MLPQTHYQFRRSVCVGCHKPGQKRTVTENFSVFVRQKIYSGYSIMNEKLPIGLCETCRAKMKSKNDFDNAYDYDQLTKKLSRRNVKDNGICECYICLAGRSKKLMNKRGKLGPKSKTPVKERFQVIFTNFNNS